MTSQTTPAQAGVVFFSNSNPSQNQPVTSIRAILTPCIGVCTLSEDGLCHGCYRTGAEIARWLQMDDNERLRLMETVLPERESRRA
jgi:predicted Fe-S protein YdhL (DUF1289 family)